MPEERAFTRRQPGVNPIALELDRLAEQKALRTLGASRPTMPGAQPAEMDPGRMADVGLAGAPAEQLSPAAKELTTAWDLTPGEMDATMQRAVTPFNYEPGDPQWSGLEEDEAYQLWTDRLGDLAKRYPDMNPREREMFTKGITALR